MPLNTYIHIILKVAVWAELTGSGRSSSNVIYVEWYLLQISIKAPHMSVIYVRIYMYVNITTCKLVYEYI